MTTESFRVLIVGGAGVFGSRLVDTALTSTDRSGMSMRVLGWRLGPFRLPRCLAIRFNARETEEADGRFRFDVAVELPFGLGRVIRYSGWLSPLRRAAD